MSQDFLSRWSRRKLKGEAPEEPAQDVAAPAPDPDEITPEELAALPAVEELTATSDLIAFLRKGVPAALRNAALRKMWVVDPEIRDFVGDARDYAWDWNVPGGVPVSGPLAEGTDVQAMVRRIFGEEPEAVPAQTAPPMRENVNTPEVVPDRTPQPERVADAAPSQAPDKPDELDAGEERAEEPHTPRRHGGALPS